MPRRHHSAYTVEQSDFVAYVRIDQDIKQTAWKEVGKRFREQFDVKRVDSAVQALFQRRKTTIPDTDRKGRLQFDDRDQVRMIKVSVTTDWKAVGLLSAYPERAIRYSWVTDKDKQKVKEIGESPGTVDAYAIS